MNIDIEDTKFLLNKNILITGASRGIGKCLALNFSKYGANTILLSKDEKLLDQVYDEIKSKYKTNPMIITCDLNNLDENYCQEITNSIQKTYGNLDALINNAAIVEKLSTIENYDLKTWEKVIKVNLTSSFLLSRFLLPILKISEIPRIIFTSSGVAKKGSSFWGAYSISKGGIKILAEILKDEVETTSKLKIFNFDPKATRTDMRAHAFPAEDPLQLKKPDELIKYYLWMLSEESSGSENDYIEYKD